MDEIDDKVNRATSDLKSTNVRLKDTVTKEETLFSMTRGLPFKGNRYDTEACPLPNLSIMLRVYMYTYGAISQYVFNVHSIFHSIADQQALQEAPLQILEPKTPKKHGITNK
ncbi:uncharacterized protein LOC131302644 isoform X2 [Rhododendron vialii]|uniref:uncharacterized protein LOC131302644 isoform X2 n=1 Tax=Rhododendron vialii TaxID=182163 RepID=UPI0026601868|nr:uncharacterized protein LOC131302644 isoform X2 [Rhododendron vialii]